MINKPIRVLVVDDAAFIRYTVSKHLQAKNPDILVVDTARNGLEALEKVAAIKPDVVVLDVEMPEMDGLTALKHIMRKHPTPVVMLSALTQKGAGITIKALMRGAVDFVPKPSATIGVDSVIEELSQKIRAAVGAEQKNVLPLATFPTPVRPRKMGPRLFRINDPLIIIGASTGGPRALHQVMSGLPANLPAAIVIVQHMPAGFTRSLAQRLNEISPLAVHEAANGDRLARGIALLTPGGFHLRMGSRRVILDKGPPRNHVRPAVDVTMESAIPYHRGNIIGVVLTGMGEDGTDGARQIKAAGGMIIAEHESTSVVYGMPASVVKAGLADRVVPLPKVASTLVELVDHGSS